MDVGAWFQTWIGVVTRPGEAIFEEERAKPQASLSTAVIWVVFVAVVSALFSWLGSLIFAGSMGMQGMVQQAVQQFGLPPEALEQLPFAGGIMAPTLGIGAFIMSLIFNILFFVLFAGLLQLVAKILGGTGNFGIFSYLLAAIFVPITVLSAVLGLIPFVNLCLLPILLIYQLVLSYYATRVEHKLTPAKSIVVVLTPLLIVLCLAACGIGVGVTAVASIMQAGQ
jgi:hypothetical protein